MIAIWLRLGTSLVDAMAGKAENKAVVQERLQAKYGNAGVSFFVDESSQIDEPRFIEMQRLMGRVGIQMNKSGTTVSISVDPIQYGKTTREFAGVDKMVAVKINDMTDGVDLQPIRYSDVMLMKARGNTHDQIMDALGMSRATYFRHYREMKNSLWYNTIDKAMADDEQYLVSIKGNDIF